jgi:hypothetical protein
MAPQRAANTFALAQGELAAADTTVSFILNKIRNPGFSGRSGDFQIVVIDPDVSELQEAEALAARQATLDSGNKVCAFVRTVRPVRVSPHHFLCMSSVASPVHACSFVE